MKSILAAIVFLAGLVPCIWIIIVWAITYRDVGLRQGIRELYPPGQWLAVAVTVVSLVLGCGLIGEAISSIKPRR